MVGLGFNWFKQEMELLPFGNELPVYLLDKRNTDINRLLALGDATYPSKVKEKT